MGKKRFRIVKKITPKPVRNSGQTAFEAMLKVLPKKTALKIRFFKSFQRWPDFDNPRSFSEKCQAIKLAGPDLSPFVDKVLVKAFARSRIGDEHIIPTLYAGPWLPEKRDWPLPYVIKTNHGSGGNIFVRESPNWPAIEQKLQKLLAYDFAAATGESFYAGVRRQVLVEPFIAEGPDLPRDYKIFTCNGEPQFIQVDTGRDRDHRESFFDPQWERIPIRLGYPDAGELKPPRNLEIMIELASKVSQGFGFVRADFYEVAGRIYFGELTFTPASGLMRFEPDRIDDELGAKWPWPPTWPEAPISAWPSLTQV